MAKPPQKKQRIVINGDITCHPIYKPYLYSYCEDYIEDKIYNGKKRPRFSYFNFNLIPIRNTLPMIAIDQLPLYNK
jgi:hypothetical protein